MYFLIDKNSKKVLNQIDIPEQIEPDPQTLFPEFNSESMEFGFGIFEEVIPIYLKVNAANHVRLLSEKEQVDLGILSLQPYEKIEGSKIVIKTLEEQVNEGLIQLPLTDKLENGEIVPKSLEEQWKEGLIQINEPFCYVEDNEIKTRSYDELIAGNYLKTKAQWEEFQTKVYDAMRRDSNAVYSLGEELEIIKDCLDWICAKLEVEEDDDPRCQKYREMQAYLVKVKAQYQPFLAKIDRALSA